MAEQITVTGETPALDRSNASVASMIDRAALENLPSTGRNPLLFSTTLPNVIPIGTPFFTRMQDQNASSLLSIAGAPPRANTDLLDGVPITDLLNRAAMIPSNEVQFPSGGTAGRLPAPERIGMLQWPSACP